MKNIFFVLSFLSFSVFADYKNVSSVSYADGTDYKLIGEDATIISFDHYSEHDWGDALVSSESWETSDNINLSLIKINPRIKLFGVKRFGIKDIFVATSIEMYQSPLLTGKDKLGGLGISFDLPEPAYMSINVYERNNELFGNQKQAELYIGSPFMIMNQLFSIDGVFIKKTEADGLVQDFSAQVSFSWNVLGDKKTWIGAEYTRWHNKFGQEDLSIPFLGIDIDTDESSKSIFIRRVF